MGLLESEKAALNNHFDRLLKAGEPDRHGHVCCNCADDILKLVDGLRERGCWSFEGMGLKLQIRPPPPASSLRSLAPESVVGLTEASHAAKTTLVDAGGGLMVDPDLLGHEG